MIDKFDFFKPGITLAVLAFADKETSIIWFITKLLLVFYLISYLKEAVYAFRREIRGPKRQKKEPQEGEEVASVLHSTPSYPTPQKYMKEDPLSFLDMEKTRR